MNSFFNYVVVGVLSIGILIPVFVVCYKIVRMFDEDVEDK